MQQAHGLVARDRLEGGEFTTSCARHEPCNGCESPGTTHRGRDRGGLVDRPSTGAPGARASSSGTAMSEMARQNTLALGGPKAHLLKSVRASEHEGNVEVVPLHERLVDKPRHHLCPRIFSKCGTEFPESDPRDASAAGERSRTGLLGESGGRANGAVGASVRQCSGPRPARVHTRGPLAPPAPAPAAPARRREGGLLVRVRHGHAR